MNRRLLLMKLLFVLLGVWIASDSLSASGWRKPTGFILGAGAVLTSLFRWKKNDFPFNPDEPVPLQRPDKDETIEKKMKRLYWTIELNLVMWLIPVAVAMKTNIDSDYKIPIFVGFAVAAILQHLAYYDIYRTSRNNSRKGST